MQLNLVLLKEPREILLGDEYWDDSDNGEDNEETAEMIGNRKPRKYATIEKEDKKTPAAGCCLIS